MHPTSNYASGASMIKHLYDAVRNSQYWDNTYVASLPTLGVWMNYPSLIKSHAVLSSSTSMSTEVSLTTSRLP